MNFLPVITRELQVQARQPFTHWLRVVGLVAMIGVVGTFVSEHGLKPGDGGQLFAFLHATLCIAIWILVPLSSADCISRERREGTLGLLFLSPLKPRDIVFAKGLAYGVRVLTLWLASLPVLIIPSLLGGVTWRDAVFSCAVILGCLALALGASVLASSFCRTWHRSVVLTILMAVLLVTIFGVLLFLGLFVAIAFFNPAFVWREFWDNTPGIGSMIVEGVMFTVGGAANLSQWLSRMPLVAQNAAVVAFWLFHTTLRVDGLWHVVAGGSECSSFVARRAAICSHERVRADVLETSRVGWILQTLDATQAGQKSHRLAGATELEWAHGFFGVVHGCHRGLQHGVGRSQFHA